MQPHYTNDPELLDGLIDPFAGRRLGLIRRRRRTVKLYMPTAQEVAEETPVLLPRHGIAQFTGVAEAGNRGFKFCIPSLSARIGYEGDGHKRVAKIP